MSCTRESKVLSYLPATKAEMGQSDLKCVENFIHSLEPQTKVASRLRMLSYNAKGSNAMVAGMKAITFEQEF